MQYLTREQRKAKARRLYLGYTLVAILSVLATYILVQTALGYELFSRGEVIQNGLLFVNSEPADAEIYINGRKESSQTNAKLSLPEGRYDVRLSKPGYNDWFNTVELRGGQVLFLNHAQLLPSVPESSVAYTFPSEPSRFGQSDDQRWVVTVPDATLPNVLIFDTENPESVPRRIPIPTAALTALPGSTYTVVSWARDNDHVMVRETAGGVNNYIVIHREKDEFYSTATLLPGEQLIQANFWGPFWDQLVVVNAANTISLRTMRNTPTIPLLSSPNSRLHAIGGESFVFSTISQAAETTLQLADTSGIYTLTQYVSSDDPLIVKKKQFNRNDYIVVAGASLDKTAVYRNAKDAVQKSSVERATPFLLLPIDAETIEFSPNGRFRYAREYSKVITYDIERRQMHEFEISASATIGWLTNTSLFTLEDGSYNFIDYDGFNKRQLAQDVLFRPFARLNGESALVIQQTNGVINVLAYDYRSPTTQSN